MALPRPKFFTTAHEHRVVARKGRRNTEYVLRPVKAPRPIRKPAAARDKDGNSSKNDDKATGSSAPFVDDNPGGLPMDAGGLPTYKTKLVSIRAANKTGKLGLLILG